MDRSCAALALVGLLAAAQAAPAATEPLRAHAPTASAGDLETAVAHARAEAVEELHELARWCRGRKLYGTRHEVLETVLVLAPDDETAREELGWRRDADGAWTRPKVPRRPRDHSKTAQREFERERAAIVDALRAKLVAAARAADVGPAELRELLDDVLALAPDDPNTRWLLGEQRRGDEWVLVDTLRAEERRADLERAVASVFARGVEETAAEPTETMEALGLDWTATVGTPHGTVTGTVPADELDRTAELLAVTHRVLVRDVLSKQASFGDGCTVFALRPEDKDAFVDGYPGLDANYRDFLRTLLGSGIQGTPDLALWGPDEADRRDMLVRAALPWLFADAYGVATAKGWIYEGFGLYLSDLIVGTRLHWFAQPEQGRSTAQDADSVGERMNDPDADWHAEAHAVLVGESPPSLPFLLGKDVNTLTAREILVSHALAAYLIECRPEVLPGVWAGIGAGESGPVVLERALDTTFEHLRPTLTRWLAERSGVEEDSDDAAPREPAPRPEPSRPASSRDDDEIELRWDGEAIALSELPEELGDAPRHAVRAWADWCLERHYALELRADGRVLLALPTSARRPERARELTARTVGHVDGALPGDAEPVTSGDGDAPAARETAVLFVLRGMGDQVLLLDALAAHEPYLADWAQGAKRQVGFVLERPLVGAYLETAPGLEEWRPENEHVHRLAELLVLRRFGRLPWWLQQGIAWEVEMELEGGVYCFPYRSEFVWATEHGAWPSEVRRMYGGRPTPALDLELLTDWNRGSFEQEAAVTAWGAANYLLAKHPEAFPAFLNDLRAFRDEADRVDDGDDTWHRDVGYEIPREEVERMLESRFGADVLADAGAYLGAGRAR